MSEPFSVVITDCEFSSFEPERKELAGIAAVKKYSCRSEEEVIRVAADADAILVQYAPISRSVIEALKRCRVIGRYGIGVDMIDIEAAAERDIPVVNVPDYCQEEVSDHAVALILALCRKILILHDSVTHGAWSFSVAAPVRRFRDLTIGLISLGRIAIRVAEKLRCFGCKLIAYDPYIETAIAARLNVELVDLPVLLKTADVVSIHCPLTEQTHRMFGLQEFKQMKESAYLVNTSRGGIVDQEALENAIEENLIAGAALDVLEKEPIPKTSRLLGRNNVILTPHSAFYSVDSLRELQIRTARGVASVLRGGEPSNVVNRRG